MTSSIHHSNIIRGDDDERDNTEKQIIEFGISKKIPIFGVCRGMQVLNKFFKDAILRTLILLLLSSSEEMVLASVRINDEPSFKVSLFNSRIYLIFHRALVTGCQCLSLVLCALKMK